MPSAIFVEDSFNSAHFLPNVPMSHKCRALHGHTYRVRIEAVGELDLELGWVVDYVDVKAAWKSLFEAIDHKLLNDSMANPTCELIAERIRLHMEAAFPALMFTVELRETETCGAVSFR